MTIITRRWLLRIAPALAITLIFAIATLFIANRRAVRQAEALLEDFRTLQVGKTTDAEVKRIVYHYGGGARPVEQSPCLTPIDRTYNANVWSGPLNILGRYLGPSRLFGNRMWDVHVVLGMTGGRLCYARYLLRAWLPGGYSIDVKSELLQQDADPFSMDIGQLRGMFRVNAHVSEAATIEEHEHALDLRLGCLTKLGGCKDPCEVFPLAWIDYQREARINGWPFPPQHYDAGCTLPADFHAQPVPFK